MDCLVGIAIVIAGCIYTYNLPAFIDIVGYDESDYLRYGITFFQGGIPDPDWAPIYALWYWFLHLFVSDPVDLYYLNYSITTILVALMFFVALRTYAVSRTLALIGASLLLISAANFPIWPRVCHVSTSIALLSFVLIRIPQTEKNKVLLSTVVALVSAFIRPECFLIFVCLLALYTGLVIRDYRRTNSLAVARPLAVVVCGSILTIAIFGLPMGGEGTRDMVAIAQHYEKGWNARLERGETAPPGGTEAIFRQDFGDAESMADVVLNNPRAFATHVVYNISIIPREWGLTFGSVYPRSTLMTDRLQIALIVAILVAAFIVFRNGWKISVDRVIERMKSERVLFLVAFLYLGVGLLSVFVIWPRWHYLQGVGVVLFFCQFVILSRALRYERRRESPVYSLVVVAILLVWIKPMYVEESKGETGIRNAPVIQWMKSLDISRPVNILEGQGGLAVYIGENYHWVAHYEKSVGLRQFLSDNKVNMILVSPRLSGDFVMSEDPEWHALIADPGAQGLVRRDIPGDSGWYLLVTEDLAADIAAPVSVP